MDQQFIENKLKPVLMYMGLIVSGIMSVAYIIIVFVLIKGFKVEAVLNTTIFSIVTSAIGFCIMQMLKIQGQTFAKNLEKNKPIVEAYSKRLSTKKNKRKYRSMNYYMIKTGISDIVSKCFSFGFASVGMVYVMIEGSGDYSLLLLALVNLLMFAGYGLINLCKAYDFYNEEYVPYMLDKIREAEELEAVDNKVETENTTNLEVAETEHNQ